MASTLAKCSGTRSTSSTTIPNRSWTKSTSLSRLSESRTPVSSSDVVFVSGSRDASWTSSWLM